MTEEESARWAELVKLAEKLETVIDPEIVGALKEALQLKADKARPHLTRLPASATKSKPLLAIFADLPREAPTESGAPEVDTNKVATPEEIDRAEVLIRQARLAGQRGNKAEHGRLLQEAENLAPNSIPVLEALAEEARNRGNIKAAKEFLQRAVKQDPKNVALERKYAEVVFGIAKAETAPLEMAHRQADAAASGRASVILSLFFPGLGQLVSGETPRGVFYLVGWLGAWMLSIANGIGGVFALMGGGAAPQIGGVAIGAAVVGLVFHITAVLDASSRAKQIKPKEIHRPVPPSQLPFE